MATLGERILEEVHVVPGLDDDELAARLGVVRQAVNQACRKLATGGQLSRGVGGTGKIINTLDRNGSRPPSLRQQCAATAPC